MNNLPKVTAHKQEEGKHLTLYGTKFCFGLVWCLVSYLDEREDVDQSQIPSVSMSFICKC